MKNMDLEMHKTESGPNQHEQRSCFLSFEEVGVVPQGQSAEAAPSSLWIHHEWASLT